MCIYSPCVICSAKLCHQSCSWTHMAMEACYSFRYLLKLKLTKCHLNVDPSVVQHRRISGSNSGDPSLPFQKKVFFFQNTLLSAQLPAWHPAVAFSRMLTLPHSLNSHSNCSHGCGWSWESSEILHRIFQLTFKHFDRVLVKTMFLRRRKGVKSCVHKYWLSWRKHVSVQKNSSTSSHKPHFPFNLWIRRVTHLLQCLVTSLCQRISDYISIAKASRFTNVKISEQGNWILFKEDRSAVAKGMKFKCKLSQQSSSESLPLTNLCHMRMVGSRKSLHLT